MFSKVKFRGLHTSARAQRLTSDRRQREGDSRSRPAPATSWPMLFYGAAVSSVDPIDSRPASRSS
jgi:hypothetical protein